MTVTAVITAWRERLSLRDIAPLLKLTAKSIWAVEKGELPVTDDRIVGCDHYVMRLELIDARVGEYLDKIAQLERARKASKRDLDFLAKFQPTKRGRPKKHA